MPQYAAIHGEANSCLKDNSFLNPTKGNKSYFGFRGNHKYRNELTCGHELCLRHMNWLRHELYLRYIISGRVRRGRFLRATNVVSNLTVNSRIIKENDINDNALAHHSTLAQE